MSLAADTVLSVATRLNTTSHNGRIGPRDNVPVTPNKNVSTGDDDLIQLAWQEECDLTRVSELFRKDLGTKDSSKVPTGSRHSSERDDADIDKILSDELEKLTVDEREQIAYDVHGLLRNSQSDPLDIDFRLAELEQEIRKVRNRKDYEKAKYLNESFVSDRSFRLMFLRCDQFNVQIAAQRIVKHFEIKRELFGDKCLARTLRMSDLNEDDMEVLNSGLFHLQPTRDVAGRLVMVFDPGLRPDIPITNIVRATWFLFDNLSRDESYQQQGVVVIALGIENGFRKLTVTGMHRFARARAGVPRKIASLHCCFDNPVWRPVVASIRLVARRDTRNRFITHFGDKASLSFQLQTYGIATDDLFLPGDGERNVNLEWHRQWLQIMRAREESQSSPRDDVMIPLRFDVLFGRGKNTREHTGNLRALHLCEMVRPQYEAAGKFEKTAIAERIVHAIRESHGRFLKWEEDGWVEVDTEAAREKISHFFRHHRTKKGAAQAEKDRSGTQTKRKPNDDGSDVVSDGVESLEAREAKQPYRWNTGLYC